MVKDIYGYEGRYQVSDEGIIYSTPKDGKQPRILKQEITKHNYRRVSLSKEGKVKRFSVHRLVLSTFTTNPQNKPQINHIDNDPSNNKLSNLEWCTAKENTAHSHNQGRRDTTYISGSMATKAKYEKTTKDKLKVILGSRFIDTFMKKGRVHCRFYCECGNIIEKRQDVVKYTSVCKKCRSKIISDRLKGHKHSYKVSVASYTLTGIHIKTYESIAKAKEDTGDCNIHAVLKGTYKQSKGVIWKHVQKIQHMEAHNGDKIAH